MKLKKKYIKVLAEKNMHKVRNVPLFGVLALWNTSALTLLMAIKSLSTIFK